MSSKRLSQHVSTNPLTQFFDYVQRHPVLANLLFIGVVLVGCLLGSQLKVQSMPDFPWPMVSVRVDWPGANAEEVYENITLPITQELRATSELRTLEGYAMPGYGFVMLDFKTGTNLSTAFDEVRNTIAQIDLPRQADQPIIAEAQLHDPLVKLILYGDQLEALRYWANAAKRSLLAEYGIDKVNIIGLPDQNMNVNFSALDVFRLQLPLTRITEHLSQTTNQEPIGRLETDQLNMTVRAPARPKRAEQLINKTTYLGGHAYRISDISQTTTENDQTAPLITYKQQPAVVLEIERSLQNGGDSIQLVNQFYQWYQRASNSWPDAIQSRLFLKEFQLIHQRLGMLIENGVWGVLAISVLLVALIQWRLALWITMGIPTAIFGALIVMYVQGMSINFLSSFGFIMALGMIVDDTIVVAENAYANFQAGARPVDAVSTAVNRMFPPVLAASFTTVGAFIPLLIMQSRYAVFLQDIPKVVIAVIIASLIECFLILPHHITTALRGSTAGKDAPLAAILDLPRFQFTHLKVALHAIASRAWLSLSLVLAAVILPIVLLVAGYVPYNFIPYIARDHIALDVEFYPGTTRTQMQQVMVNAEKALYRADRIVNGNQQQSIIETPLVKYQLPSVASEAEPVFSQQKMSHAAMVVELTPPSQRTISNAQIKAAWLAQLEQSPLVKKSTVKEPQSDSAWQDINLLITGDDWESLSKAADEAKKRLAQYDAVYNITENSTLGGAEYEVVLKPTARMLGLTKQGISKQLQHAFQGGEITEHNLSGNEQLTIQVTLNRNDISNPAELESMPIMVGQQQMALGDLADLHIKHRPSMYYLHNGNLAIRVGADVQTEHTSAAKIRSRFIKEDLPAIKQRFPVHIQDTLQSPDEKDAIDEMATGSVVAVIVIYFVLAWVTRSYWWPLAMMLIIPVGLSGAIFGHYIMQADFSLLSMIAVFGLSGVVVNTAIILFNQYEQQCQLYPKRSPSEQVIQAICHRFRAIALTTLTTTLGLAPILLERSQQAKWVHPFAISIIFGLLFAVLAIAISVPALVAIAERNPSARRRSS